MKSSYAWDTRGWSTPQQENAALLELFVNREGNFATKARGMNVFRGSVRDTSVVKSKCILYTCVFSISVASSIYYVLQEQHILTLLLLYVIQRKPKGYV